MYNIEYKIFIGADKNIKKRLITLGAKYISKLYQKDTYFNCGEERLKLREIKNKKPELILYNRPDNKASCLSYYKIISVDNKMKLPIMNMFNNLFGKKVEVIKKRNLWFFKHTRVHLDEVEHLGNFLELETVIKNIDRKTAKKEHEDVKKLLKLSEFKPVKNSYCDLMLANKS